MHYFEGLCSDLDDVGLGQWRRPLEAAIAKQTVHGNLAEWLAVIDQLPGTDELCTQPHAEAVEIAGPHLAAIDTAKLRRLLQQLVPWRKGPFLIQDIFLDAEWQSNLKWDRIQNAVGSLDEHLILDVGSGNGYYACRMLAAGARYVLGIDPTQLFVCQFAALRKISGIRRAQVLPLRLHELPDRGSIFDTTFSMGVLYHQRDPHEHLRQLKCTLRTGGQLVLETLVLPGTQHQVIQPHGRYARMRNVWHLPTVATLMDWLAAAGFENPRTVNVSVTSTNEQRSTDWMPFESLAHALDTADDSLTVEGLAAPTRAVIVCQA